MQSASEDRGLPLPAWGQGIVYGVCQYLRCEDCLMQGWPLEAEQQRCHVQRNLRCVRHRHLLQERRLSGRWYGEGVLQWSSEERFSWSLS